MDAAHFYDPANKGFTDPSSLPPAVDLVENKWRDPLITAENNRRITAAQRGPSDRGMQIATDSLPVQTAVQTTVQTAVYTAVQTAV